MFWIRSDLWATKMFRVSDLHLVQPGDTLCQEPKVYSFAGEIWGKGERESFAQVLRSSMAGRTNRGRGRGVGVERFSGMIRIGGTLTTLCILDSLHLTFNLSTVSTHNPLLLLCTCLSRVLLSLAQILVICSIKTLRIGQDSRMFRGNRPRGAPQRQRQEEVKPKEDATPQPDEKSVEEFEK
jgi:hypothetical protein